MNHEISLTLELLERSVRGFRFRMTTRNHSHVALLFTYPEMHGLRFTRLHSMRECEWYSRTLVSSIWCGFTLDPSETLAIDWQVHPCEIEPPERDDSSDYYRWCVDLSAGDFLVQFHWRVDSNSFDPDSHARFTDLNEEARRLGATVWMGETSSNHVAVSWADPGVASRQMRDRDWKELFFLLRRLEVGPLRWKFAQDDRVYTERAPPAELILERNLGDVRPFPYAPLRDIEWIEIAEPFADVVRAIVDEFPNWQSDSCLRVLGCAH